MFSNFGPNFFLKNCLTFFNTYCHLFWDLLKNSHFFQYKNIYWHFLWHFCVWSLTIHTAKKFVLFVVIIAPVIVKVKVFFKLRSSWKCYFQLRSLWKWKCFSSSGHPESVISSSGHCESESVFSSSGQFESKCVSIDVYQNWPNLILTFDIDQFLPLWKGVDTGWIG